MSENLNCRSCTESGQFGFLCEMNIRGGKNRELEELKQERLKAPDPIAKSKITGKINAVVNGCNAYLR